MAIDYREVLKELRAEEDRLQKELDIVRDALPAMEAMASKMLLAAPTPPAYSMPKYALMGTKEAIIQLLSQSAHSLMPADIARALIAGGIQTRASDFASTVGSTLNHMKGEGIVQRMEDGWRLSLAQKVINAGDAGITALRANALAQLSPQ